MTGMVRAKWEELSYLLKRKGNIIGEGFEPSEEFFQLLQNINILVVGAGGLGCEILKDLALSGFQSLSVIDMDTIDISNLNRQFLFRDEDVGKYKADVAAARVSSRVRDVHVTPYNAKIQDFDSSFYAQFQIVVLGLDSLEARQYMNDMICSMLEYDEQGVIQQGTIRPIIDGGTEGMKGHVRVIYPGITPCFTCTLWLYPPQVTFPLCTLAETPRTPVHCIEYAKLVQWVKEFNEVEFDGDDVQHVQWVYNKALQRAVVFGIEGVTLTLTQGVVKNIIPAIASTNAIVSAQCVLEVFKSVTCCSTSLDNYMMYTGGVGVYTHTVHYDKDDQCLACSAGVPVCAPADCTVEQLLVSYPPLQGKLSKPSLSSEQGPIYLRGVMQAKYVANLPRKLAEVAGELGVGGGGGERRFQYTMLSWQGL